LVYQLKEHSTGHIEQWALGDDMYCCLEQGLATLAIMGVRGMQAVSCIIFTCEHMLSQQSYSGAENWVGRALYSGNKFWYLSQWGVVECAVCWVPAWVSKPYFFPLIKGFEFSRLLESCNGGWGLGDGWVCVCCCVNSYLQDAFQRVEACQSWDPSDGDHGVWVVEKDGGEHFVDPSAC
jgi:hypothetical protein